MKITRKTAKITPFLKSGMLWGSNKTVGLGGFEKGIEEGISNYFCEGIFKSFW